MRVIIAIAALSISAASFGQDPDVIKEHVYGGLPSTNNVHTRTAYAFSYNFDKKAPVWVAYHLTEDYRRTPRTTN